MTAFLKWAVEHPYVSVPLSILVLSGLYVIGLEGKRILFGDDS